jgi:hypothetical protein
MMAEGSNLRSVASVQEPPTDQDDSEQQEQMDSTDGDLDPEPQDAPDNHHRKTDPEQKLHRSSET